MPRLVESQLQKDEIDTNPEKLTRPQTLNERFAQGNLQDNQRYDSPSFSKMIYDERERKEGSEVRLMDSQDDDPENTELDQVNMSKISAFGLHSKQKLKEKQSLNKSILRRMGSTDKADKNYKEKTENFIEAFKTLNKKTQQDISRLLQTLMIERAAGSPTRNEDRSKLGSIRNNYL